jgi:hypothetical protein
MSTAKRVFFYVVCLATLYMFASGVMLLLPICFNLVTGEYSWAGFARTEFSMGLSLLLIGGVLWYLFWRAVQRQVAENPAETGSAVRKLYLNAALLVTAFVGLFGAAGFVRWLMGGVPLDRFPSEALSMLIAGGGIWYYHRRVEDREGQPSANAKTLRRWYIYILAGFGLIMLALSVIQLLDAAILHLFWSDIARSSFWNISVQRSITWILLGGGVWVHYWFYAAKGDTGSTLRWVYLYLLVIPGGAIAGLTALIFFLFEIFMFAFGGTGAAGSSYFLFLGWTIPTMLVVTLILAYHQRAVQQETAQLRKQQLSARRIFLYLVSFLGLGTLIAGLITLLGVLLDLIINATSTTLTVTAGWWHNQFSLGLALLVVSAPIWLYYWKKVLRMVAEGGVEERGTRSRRIYLYVILGIAVITLTTVVVNIVYQLINGLLQGDIGTVSLQNMKWSLQTLLIPLPVLLYHWHLLREDRRLGAEKVLPRKRVTMLASEQAAELVAGLQERLGSRIRLLRRLSMTGPAPALSGEELDKLVSEISDAPGGKVMLVVTGSGVMVLPYEDK